MSWFWNWSVRKPPISSAIASARSRIGGMSCGVIPSGLGTTSSVAPNACIVRSFSSANASEDTMSSG